MADVVGTFRTGLDVETSFLIALYYPFSGVAAQQARRIQEYALVGENVEAKEMLMIGRSLVRIKELGQSLNQFRDDLDLGQRLPGQAIKIQDSEQGVSPAAS